MLDFSASELEEIRHKIRLKRIYEWVSYVISVVSINHAVCYIYDSLGEFTVKNVTALSVFGMFIYTSVGLLLTATHLVM